MCLCWLPRLAAANQAPRKNEDQFGEAVFVPAWPRRFPALLLCSQSQGSPVTMFAKVEIWMFPLNVCPVKLLARFDCRC